MKSFSVLVLLPLFFFSSANAQNNRSKLEIQISKKTGHASFLRLPDTRTRTNAAFFTQYGNLFGISNPQAQLRFEKTWNDSLGFTHTKYQQIYEGLEVFSGVFKIHQDSAGVIRSANGHFYSIPEKLSLAPSITQEQALNFARGQILNANPQIELTQLLFVDPGWYGDRPTGVRLAYYLIFSDTAAMLREAFFVDAHSGQILDRWNMIHSAKFREIHNGGETSNIPGPIARTEGQGPAGDSEVDAAYDYTGDVYDFYQRAFGRDGANDAGLSLIVTVHSQPNNPPCPNAFWNGNQMVFCTGLATDDVIAHEFTHGVTQFSAGLVYQNQPGQLNEAYSDIMGELIDFFNGNAAFPGAPSGPPFWPVHPSGPGNDTPNNLRGSGCSGSPDFLEGRRWLVGEDNSGLNSPIRDMWNPPCRNHPDRANSELQTCNPADNGGVHSGSGVANHAFAIMTDGKTFNGYTVNAIGPIKSGAIWYRALTVYLNIASDFQDAYTAINQAALDLVGSDPNDPRTGLPSGNPITVADAAEVDKALLAVEMNTDGSCGSVPAVLDSNPPPECPTKMVFYSDDFEGGVNGWTVSNSNPPTPYHWVQQAGLPYGRPGTAWFCADPSIGNCASQDESGTHTLFSPTIVFPGSLFQPTLSFTHYLASEPGWDGGNLSIRVNAGPWQLIPSTAFSYNAYNTVLNGPGAGNTNPLGGQEAWSGAGGQWGTSLVNLDSFVQPGNSVQFRFDFGKDGCTGVDGWYLDDFKIYNCPCSNNADCQDLLFCNGVEICDSGVCVPGVSPCSVGEICDESQDSCVGGVVFYEDFESGNIQSWDLNAPGSTASSGLWLFGNPNGTSTGGEEAQPEDAFEGLGCAFTGQNFDLGNDDVDNGVTYLRTPVLDLGNYIHAELAYRRWFFNRDLGEDGDDFFSVELSNNNGASWTTLEILGSTDNDNQWALQNFTLENFLPLTNQMRIRFGTSDGIATGNLIEGALDNVLVLGVPACNSPSANAIGSRHLLIQPPSSTSPIAISVRGNPSDSDISCLDLYVQVDGSLGATAVFQTSAAWGTVLVKGAEILPQSLYEIRTDCGSPELSPKIDVSTGRYADFDENNLVNLDDILDMLAAFSGSYAPGTQLEDYDIVPCMPNGIVNLDDILAVLTAFSGGQLNCPNPCP